MKKNSYKIMVTKSTTKKKKKEFGHVLVEREIFDRANNVFKERGIKMAWATSRGLELFLQSLKRN